MLGLLIVGFLIFKGNIERVVIAALTLMILNVIKSTKLKFDFAFLLFLGLVIGYILGNFLLYYSVISNDNSGTNIDEENENRLLKPAVIIFSKGEPDNFDLPVILKNIYNDKSIIKRINGPIEVYSHKIAYENVGSSKNTDMFSRIKDDLKERLGVDYDIYTAYFNTEPLIDEEIMRLGKQYERLILVPLMLSESEDYSELEEAVEKKYINSKVEIKITPLLWKSQKLSRQILQQAVEATGRENIGSAGIVFVMSNDYDFYEQGIFCNETISKMEQSKFDKEKIICLKYEGDEKLILKAIRRLEERGAENILVINVSSLQDEIKNQDKISNLVKKASKKEFVNIQYLSGWGIGENLLNELEYKIRIVNLKD